MTGRALRGRGVTVIPAATTAGRDLLFTSGASVPEAADWSKYAPRLIDRGDGKPVVDTAFTRLTGKSPILLAGMTPTTVDPEIVAAAANAGHWAELAGGGQVTEGIFDNNVAKLTELLDEGRTAQFNTLFLDPYLWKLHVGGQRLLQKARLAGAPFDGLVISAGIPELEDAVDIIEDLHESGITHVVFKPGTVKQIRQVLAIAREVDTTVVMHIEGGVAGGHHSWEDLDELLLATYADLRSVENLVVCVGGGIGTPDRAVDYLTGAWATSHGETAMPVDGVLIGTAAMATKEATTSAAVKQLLVETPGVRPERQGGWVGAGRSDGNITSGRSQLGADIHEIDNGASRAGRVLDEVAGDLEAALARKDELIEAMADTCKPYFGDVAEMTYEQWLRRYVELSGPGTTARSPLHHRSGLGRTGSTSPSATASRRCWTAPWRASTPRPPVRSSDLDVDLEDPTTAIDTLVAEYPEATSCRLHPADVQFFLEICRRPGKPVNFVPVIDADVRRWWRSDSLWQAHDESYGADQVIVIPGPVAVGGITEVDEPVADLLDRFEDAVVADLSGADDPPCTLPRAGAPSVKAPPCSTPRSPRRTWCGPAAWSPTRCTAWREPPPSFVPEGDDAALLQVPLSRGELQLRVDLSGVAERSAAGDLHRRRHRGDGRPAGPHRRRHPSRGGRRHRHRPRRLVPGPGRRPHRRDQPRPDPSRRRRRRPGGAGSSRRARRTRLACRLRQHRRRRGTARPGAPRPPHRDGEQLRRLDHDAELTITATRGGVSETTAGQVIAVDVRITAPVTRPSSRR